MRTRHSTCAAVLLLVAFQSGAGCGGGSAPSGSRATDAGSELDAAMQEGGSVDAGADRASADSPSANDGAAEGPGEAASAESGPTDSGGGLDGSVETPGDSMPHEAGDALTSDQDARSESGPDGATTLCDQVTDVSLTGANPYGPWSYGWSNTLGAPFTQYTEYFQALDFLTVQLVDAGLAPSAWTSGALGGQIDPGAFFNGTGTAYVVASAGVTSTLPPNEFMLHPGPSGQYSVARWTAASTMTVEVEATFIGLTAGGTSTTTDVHVRHNGADFATGSSYLNVSGSPNTFVFATSVGVSAGDTLDFAVGDGGNGYGYDWTGVSARVCYASARDGG